MLHCMLQVWSEPSMVEAGAYEFADTAKFLTAGESQCSIPTKHSHCLTGCHLVASVTRKVSPVLCCMFDCKLAC